jgi:AraC-like DNA-binding protein
MNPSTVCIKAVRVCVLAAARSGISVEEAVQRLDIAPALLGDPHARVPHALFLRAWQELPPLSGDPAFGLHAAEVMSGLPFDLIDYICAQVPTLREAIGRILRYQRLIHDDVELALDVAEGEAQLTMRLRAEPCAPRHFSEYVIAIWALRARAFIGPVFTLRRASFQHGPPADVEPHRRLFRAPLDFRAPRNGLTFSAELLDAPVLSADPALGVLLDRHATELLERLPPRDSLVHRVRAHLLRALPGELPAIEATARALGASVRTLQRALRSEGTTYQQVGDEVRRDLSLGYLRDAQRTISEVAFLLGFNEVAAFTRAFRRWTGEVPSAYRDREAR